MTIHRLHGKTGFNPNAPQHLGLKYARTWARSFALVPEVDMPILALVETNDWPEKINQPIFQTVHPPYPGDTFQQVVIDIPTQPFDVPDSWDGTLAQPTWWIASLPALIQYKDCLTEEHHPKIGWDCGASSLDDIVRALANNAAHEISHMFGTLHDTDDNEVPGFIIDTYTDDCPIWMGGACIGHLLAAQSEYVESNYDKSFGPDNYSILMNALGPAPPDNPDLSSNTHSKGQPSCDQALTVEWVTPYAARGVGGYSYAIVSQDDPFYNENRTPDDNADLDSSATSLTTSSLEPGHIWEFNIRTIDADGVAGRFYSSFWVQIESCGVEVTYPHAGQLFQVGNWDQVIWNPVEWDGNDVSAGYDIEMIDLFKGNDLVMNLWTNYNNLGSMPWKVPVVEAGSDYRIGVFLIRNAVGGDQFPEYPERLIGNSEYFTIAESPIDIFNISGGAYNYPEGGRYRASFSMDVTTDPSAPRGWLQYYFTKTRMRFASTSITDVSVENSIASIAGEGMINGMGGYTFTASITDGNPDIFGITITDSEEEIIFGANPDVISGGDLSIEAQ